MHSEFQPIFVVLTAIGSILIAVGLFMLVRSWRAATEWIATEGTVIDLEESRDEGVSYSPIVRFSTRDQREITFTDSISTRPAMFKVGEVVKVLYDPENHDRARIGSTFRLYISAMVAGGLGVIFLIIGLLGLDK